MWLSWYKVNVFQFFETCSCLVFKPSKCMALKNQHANMKDMCLHAYITIYIYIHTWLCKSDKKPISFPWASGSRIELPACKVLSRVFERHLFDLNLYIYRFQNIVYIYSSSFCCCVDVHIYIETCFLYIYIYTPSLWHVTLRLQETASAQKYFFMVVTWKQLIYIVWYKGAHTHSQPCNLSLSIFV